MTRYILPRAAEIRPCGAYAFFDTLAVWLREPLTDAELARLRARCGHLHAENRPARFDARMRQRVEVKQPSGAALALLSGLKGALVNRADLALDWVFDTEAEQRRAYEVTDRHLVRRWHGRSQPVLVHPGQRETRYDAGLRSPNRTVFYKDDHSRVTGELHCLHVEWRASGARAVRAAGIRSPADLPSFPHRKFWERRLLLREIDHERLGRLARNTASKTRSRRPATARMAATTINLDRRLGGIMTSVLRDDYGRGTVQEIIDRYGASLRLSLAMRAIPCETLLPE